ERDDEDFDLTFYFEEPSGKLISITRNYFRPKTVKNQFKADARFHTWRDGRSVLHAASRELSRDRILIAIGIDNLEAPCSQAVLMRRSRLHYFYPWIAQDLSHENVK